MMKRSLLTAKSVGFVCLMFVQLSWAVPASVLADSKQASAVADTTKDIVKRSSAGASGEPADPMQEPVVPMTSAWNRNADDGSVQVRPAPQKRGVKNTKNFKSNNIRPRDHNERFDDEVLAAPSELTSDDYYSNRFPIDGAWADESIDESPSASSYNLYHQLLQNTRPNSAIGDGDGRDDYKPVFWNDGATYRNQQQLERQQQQRAYDNLQAMANANMYEEPNDVSYASTVPYYLNPYLRYSGGPSSDRKKRSTGGTLTKSSSANMRSKRDTYMDPADMMQLLALAEAADERRSRVVHPSNSMQSRDPSMMFGPQYGYRARDMMPEVEPRMEYNVDNSDENEQWLRTPVAYPSYQFDTNITPSVYRQPRYPIDHQQTKRFAGSHIKRSAAGGFIPGFDSRLLNKADAQDVGSRKFHAMKFV